MKRVMTESCFVLAVFSTVGWLAGLVALAILSVMAKPEHEKLRELCTWLSLAGEVPVLLFGWLYQRLKV